MKNNTDAIKNPQKISSYFRLEKLSLAVVTVSGLIYNVGMAAQPWFEGQLAQRLYDVEKGKKTFQSMLILAAVYAAVILFVQLMRALKRFYVRRFANNTNKNMRHILYCNLVGRSTAEVKSESVGALMTKAVADVDACAEGMRKFTTEVFDTGVVLISYTFMLFYYDYRLALICCIFPIFAYVFADRMKKTVSECTASYRKSAENLNGATLERVSGAVSFRSFGVEEKMNERYERRLDNYEKSAMRANVWENAMAPLYLIVSMLGVIPIIFFGAKNVSGGGWSTWNIASFTAFLSTFARLALKSSKAAKLFNSVQKAKISWQRIKPLMSKPAEFSEVSKVPRVADFTAENLAFSYPDGKKIFTGLSFSAHRGEIIGITGEIASGKSTLGKILLYEYEYGGSIKLDGRELRTLKNSEYISYMGHNAELMSGSVEENIALGDKIDTERYLKDVSLFSEIEKMPRKSLTAVGSGGVGLSGGQAARVALARVLAHKRSVIVLDDPFSAVDAESEDEIIKNIKRECASEIVFIISHRLKHFPEFDKVIFLENGSLKCAPHETLYKENTHYARIFDEQSEGKKDEE